MSSQKEIRNCLANSTLFSSVSEEALDEIAAIVEETTLPHGTTLFQQGEPDDRCYIIVTGGLRALRTDKEGRVFEFMALGPGESFGELALLSAQPKPLSAETKGESHLLVISKKKFASIQSKHPDVMDAVGKRVGHWLHMASAAIEGEATRQSQAPGLSWLDFALTLGLAILCALVFNGSNPNGIALFPKSTLDEAVSFAKPLMVFESLEKEEILIIDAMPSGFFEKEHIEGAVSLPLAIFDFMYDMALSEVEKGTRIVIYGRTVSKRYDEEVANKLIVRGHRRVQILDGGMGAWKKNGYPVES